MGSPVVLLPLAILVILASFLFVTSYGIKYEISYPPMQILAPAIVDTQGYFTEKEAQTLVMYDSQAFAGTEHIKTVLDVMDSMQVKYDVYDVSKGGTYDLSHYKNVVVSFIDLEKQVDHIPELMAWGRKWRAHAIFHPP